LPKFEIPTIACVARFWCCSEFSAKTKWWSFFSCAKNDTFVG